MLVIENPHTHLPLLRFPQNNVQGFPPCFFAEMFIRARLYAKCSAAAFCNFLNLCGKLCIMPFMQPEKWQQVIVGLAVQYAFQNSVHFPPSPVFQPFFSFIHASISLSRRHVCPAEA